MSDIKQVDCNNQVKHVNKKKLPRSYTSTQDVLSLKRTMKQFQQRQRNINKAIKFQNELLKELVNNPNGKTTSQVKLHSNTLDLLSDDLELCKHTIAYCASEIQLTRQQTFESLTDYHPDREVAKMRLTKVNKLGR